MRARAKEREKDGNVLSYKAKVKSVNSTAADTLMVDINIIFGEHASPLLIKVRGMVELSPMFPVWIFPY